MVQLDKTSASYTESGLFKVVSFVIISLLLVSCGAGRTTVSSSKTFPTLQDDIIQYGRQYLGKPYRYAGRGPDAFDCSGYTAFVFKEFGYTLDSGSAGQERQFPHITDREKLQKGDLVFFEGRRKNGKVEHVGIVTETLPNGVFRFIHASTGSGVIITSSSDYYWASRYLHGGRVLEENKSSLSEEKNDTVYHINNVAIVKNDSLELPEPKLVEVKGTTPGYHTVKMGETLYAISRRYNCTVDQLRSWNPQLGEILKVGDLIRVSN